MIQPLHEYIVIRPSDPPESPGGILIPATARCDTSNKGGFIREWNRFCAGTVVTVGKGKKVDADHREASDLEEGQRVFYKRAEAVELPGEGDLVIVRENSIAFEILDGEVRA